VNDSAIQPLPEALLVEVDTLRDQRDLYRSLLLSELAPLASCMAHALETVERIRAALRLSTRDAAAFRGKIERLQQELADLTAAMLGLHLPSIASRVASAQQTLRAIELRTEISGNDLLPAMVTLEELCSHLLIAADCAAVHLPSPDEDAAADELASGQIMNLLALDRRVEGEVELIEVFDLAEHGGFDAAADQSAGPYVQLVLENQFQELAVIEPVARRLAEADFKALGQAREPKLFECL